MPWRESSTSCAMPGMTVAHFCVPDTKKDDEGHP